MDDLTRRDFLRVAGLVVAGAAGASAAFAQEDKTDNEKKEEDKPDDKPKDKNDVADLFGDSDSSEETRPCPQCGALMYLQGNTWTCDNCGYSYVE